MCFKEITLNIANNIVLVTCFLFSAAYLIYFLIIKKRKTKIGYILVAILIILFGLLINKGVINNMKKCAAQIVTNVNKEEEPNSTTTNITTTITTTKKTETTTKNTTKTTTTNKSETYVGETSKGYQLEKKSGAYYIDHYLIVNKSYPLDSNWIPSNTYSKISAEICKTCIDNTAYESWLKMKNDAISIGLNIYIASGYRSYQYQGELYQSYLKRDGKDAADTYSARAGHSEHQSGLAFDLNSVDSSFAATDEGKWVNDNAHLYGFIIRYPKDKTNETGYKYESWHLRYVGLELAEKLYNDGNWITMESYFGIDSKYS